MCTSPHRTTRQDKSGEIAHWTDPRAVAAMTRGWSTPAGERRAARRVAWLAAEAGLGPGRVVLEIGCGTGCFTGPLAATGATLVAVDLSETLLGQARAAGSAPGARLAAADVETLPFPDAAFHGVVGVSVPLALRRLNLDPALASHILVTTFTDAFGFLALLGLGTLAVKHLA